MKVNSKILSIPPYISTSWGNISLLHMDSTSTNLVISLKDGNKIIIPNLSGNDLDGIFAAHSEFLEQQTKQLILPNKLQPNFDNTLNIGISSNVGIDGLENFTGIMQHDSNQKDAPLLPKEILLKIAKVSEALGINNEEFHLSQQEPHCNCPYCQITRAMQGGKDIDNDHNEQFADTECIENSDLTFKEWNIEQVGDKLYNVSNPIDNSELYQVYLGNPIGCTCGKNNCEHVISVLHS